ncbi:MAG: DUF4129 domain-containing protein, partial [Halodesulfurarchaeum sp.]
GTLSILQYGGLLVATLVGLLAMIRGYFNREGVTGGGSSAPDTGAEAASDTGVATSETRLTLREVWLRFVRMVGVRRWRTKTPGEISRRAVAMGFPEGPVATLRDAFREVEFGNRDPEDSLPRAEDAYRELDERDGGSEPEGDG